MKKRIGILTYHRSNNYGAFMQAYSLSKRVGLEFPECSVDIVDYLSKEVYCLYRPSFFNYCYMVLHASSFRKKLSYTKSFFLNLKKIILSNSNEVNNSYFEEAFEMLPLSKDTIITDEYKTIKDYLNQQYDIIVVGSDAVWNWQIRPFPNVYFLGKEITTKKLSYAASSYGQPYKNISNKNKLIIRAGWDTFDYIGVRDIPTENFVEYITGSAKGCHNCDPTVFLDIDNLPVDRELVENKLKHAGWDNKRKTICIMAQPWLAKFVKSQLGNEYQIVSVFKHSEYADVNLLDINPFEWTVCFSFFDITITHYFHGNLLSLKNGTPTILIEQKSDYNQMYCSKIRDFMQRIDLIDCCFFIDELQNDSEKFRVTVEKLLSDKTYCNKLSTGINKEQQSYESFHNALNSIVNS